MSSREALDRRVDDAREGRAVSAAQGRWPPQSPLLLAAAEETKARELARLADRGEIEELARELAQVLSHDDAIVIARAFELVRAGTKV